MHASPGAAATQQQARKREGENLMKLLGSGSETVRKVGLGQLKRMIGEDLQGTSIEDFAAAVHEAKDDKDTLQALAEMLEMALEQPERKKAKLDVK